MNNTRTVSDTKRAFYSIHTRPVNSIYRRVVEELMVEMHLLLVNVDFQYDPIYALGVVTAFDRFMQGYLPESDRESIFNALIGALQDDPARYRAEANRLQEFAQTLSVKDLVSWTGEAKNSPGDNELQHSFHKIATNPKYKYSRLFAIGLFTLVEKADPQIIEDHEKAEETLAHLASGLNLPQDKLQKDLELYRSNLEKLIQARTVMDEIAQ
ncbi:MAG: photosystem II biogenesis protein Psp29, partial [Cyanobacteriota bacterium]|nr:photosystem II biogenesis protein Psp29 [Cyanobacteriota bacterium]